MDNKYSLEPLVNSPSIKNVTERLVEKVKTRRKEQKLTQRALSDKSGVAYASIRRFESFGEISLASLLKIAKALDCLEDFDLLFATRKIVNLKDFGV